MGFWSWWSKPKDDDYPTLLASLDAEIRTVSARLSEIRLRERRASVWFSIYAFGFWIAYVSLWWFGWRGALDAGAVEIAPVVVIPLVIIFTRRIVRWWYRRTGSAEERHLQALRKQQREKIEELKRKTQYYSTRELLDKYDDSLKRTGQGPGPGMGRGPGQGQGQGQGQGLRVGMAQAGGPGGAGGVAVGRGGMVGTTALEAGAEGRLRNRLPGQPSGVERGGFGPAVVGGTGAGHQVRASMSNAVDLMGAGAGGLEAKGLRKTGSVGALRQAPPPPLAASAYGSTPAARTWYEKVADAILGEGGEGSGPESRYALICSQCFAHNGLARSEEFDTIRYMCPRCGHMNGPRVGGGGRGTPGSSPRASPVTSPTRATATAAGTGTGTGSSPLAVPPRTYTVSRSSDAGASTSPRPSGPAHPEGEEAGGYVIGGEGGEDGTTKKEETTAQGQGSSSSAGSSSSSSPSSAARGGRAGSAEDGMDMD